MIQYLSLVVSELLLRLDGGIKPEFELIHHLVGLVFEFEALLVQLLVYNGHGRSVLLVVAAICIELRLS